MGSDFLALVGSVEKEFVVVDAHFLVWIDGLEGDLNGGIEEGWTREVELVEVSFFERELRF